MSQFPPMAERLALKLREDALENPSRAVAFQGAPGCNGHAVALECDPECLPLPCFSFEDALEAVQTERAGSAVIPIENSAHGRVADIHFLLPQSGLKIEGEYFLRVHHALMSTSGEMPEIAISHPQALGQSRNYLRQHGIEPRPYFDTAGAAAHVRKLQKPHIGAVAPVLAANLYELKVIDQCIEDAANNTTRFVILSNRSRKKRTSQHAQLLTTFVFEVKNQPAALYKVLGAFATNGLNLTKLESYQDSDTFTVTKFYVDVCGSPNAQKLSAALKEARFHCKNLEILGTYRQARSRKI